MRKPRIGMIGLGNIAQKAYLPILTKETNWTFVGAFSPNKEKRKIICDQYRINEFNSIAALLSESDAFFVHSSTSSHFDVVSLLLSSGKDVYVDKPLTASIDESEKLVALAIKHDRKLMVGFNRRFTPMYVEAKEQANNIASIRFEKHRMNSVGPYSYDFTMLDDYLHLVDTVRWLADGDLKVIHSTMNINNENNLIYAGHLYKSDAGVPIFTEMHRKAGTNLEKLELITDGAIVRIKNMNTFEMETNNQISIRHSPSWDTTLKQRGFEDCINHFIDCIQNDQKPKIDGVEGLKSQILLHQLVQLERS